MSKRNDQQLALVVPTPGRAKRQSTPNDLFNYLQAFGLGETTRSQLTQMEEREPALYAKLVASFANLTFSIVKASVVARIFRYNAQEGRFEQLAVDKRVWVAEPLKGREEMRRRVEEQAPHLMAAFEKLSKDEQRRFFLLENKLLPYKRLDDQQLGNFCAERLLIMDSQQRVAYLLTEMGARALTGAPVNVRDKKNLQAETESDALGKKRIELAALLKSSSCAGSCKRAKKKQEPSPRKTKRVRAEKLPPPTVKSLSAQTLESLSAESDEMRRRGDALAAELAWFSSLTVLSE